MGKKFKKLKTFAIALFAFSSVYADSYVQLFHNCSDPSAATVSVYVDFGTGQTLLSPSFAFRSATTFLTVPSGIPITAYIKAPGASASDPAIYSEVLGPLTTDSSYIVVASGVVSSGFAANPNSISTAFDLKIIAPAKSTASNAGKVDFAVFHGVTDAPAVDVNLTGGSTLVPNAAYGDASGYLSVDPTWYPIDIAAAGDSNVVASYVADLSGLSGGAAVVFASGFFSPSANNNGPAFGLFAVLANGTVVELPIQQNANVQVIHNCADPTASSVDIYIDGGLALDNFAFRTATTFIPLLAGVNHTIAVAPPTSTSITDAIVTFPNISLVANSNYTVIASGVVGTGFAANPDGRSTGFDLKIIANARTTASNASKIDFAVFHGATDAPAVDVNLTGGVTLISNTAYGDASGYLSVDATWYPIEIAVAGTSTVVASYVADLTNLNDGAAIIFASGFLNPSANNNGSEFGLYAALSTGTVIALPLRQSALVQVVHNCADPIADSVDVYINGTLALDNFAFRTATPFISLTAGFPNNLAIAPKNSTSLTNAIWQKDYTLSSNANYVLTASGVVSSGFVSNPDGQSIAFDVLLKGSAKTQASVPTNFDFYVIHGSTDAPIVDVVANEALTIVNNASYGAQTDYIEIPAGSYSVSVRDSSGTNTLASYVADVTSLAGSSTVIIASGFLNPSSNNNGEAFGLFVVLPAGGEFIPLTPATSITNITGDVKTIIFPNPSEGYLSIKLNLTRPENVTVEIVDVSGKKLSEVLNNTTLNGIHNVTIDLSGFNNGVYFVRTITSDKAVTSKFTLIR